MSNHRRVQESKNIYSSACIQALEQEYCSSCNAAVISPCLVSSQGFGERLISRIYNGGRQAIYTATVGAMLVNNVMPAWGYYGANTSVRLATVSSGQISSGLYAVGSPAASCYGDIMVLGGGTTSNTIIDSLGREILVSGAKAYSTTANYWGTQLVSSGGVAYDMQVIDGGYQVLYRGGVASNTSLSIGSGGRQGMQLISSGGSAVSTVMYNGGWQYVSYGGKSIDAIVSSGGAQFVLDHGSSINTVISSGGELRVVSGGSALNVQQLEGGNIVTNITGQGNYISGINQYGDPFWVKNTSGYNIIMNRGANIVMHGGIVSNTIMNGGLLWVESGAIASSSVLNSGGVQSIIQGGITRDTIINSGGIQRVAWSGGASYSTTINNGGSQIITSGGTANSTTINANGSQIISSGGIANSTIINSAGSQVIETGGVANHTLLRDGGEQYIQFSGRANNTSIEAGGSQIVANGGIVDGTVVLSSGTQEVASGGLISGSIISSGGIVLVENGGSTVDIIVNNGGIEEIVSGGVANGTTLNSGGEQKISFGGLALSTVVNTDGIQNVLSGGLASSTTLSGGVQNVSGSVVDTSLYANGTQNIYTSGSAISTIIFNGTQNVQGTADETTLFEGTQNIRSGGRGWSTQLNGGEQNIFSSGMAAGTVLNNGAVNLYQGGALYGLSATGGALNVYGDNTLQGNITLAHAHVNIQHESGMNTLGIQNLSANNAVFNMNVDLVEQTGDKLSITDTYTGNANLQLTNVAAGAKETTENGIKLVEFGSAATVNGTFDLVGGQWDEGGYIYKLQQGTQAGEGSDYYLRSTGVLTDTFKTILNVPVMNAMIAQTGMNSLQKRLGDLRAMNNPDAKQGIWVRSYYKDMTVKDLAKTDMNLFGAEAGYDWLFRADEPTKLYAGVLVGFVSANSIKTENNKGMYDKGDGEAPGVGVYATLINESGWFVDIAARNFWSKLDMKNHASDGMELAYKPKRNVFAASVEAGKSFNTALARNRFIRIEPKVEVGYMNAASSTTDVANTGNQIKYDAANYINAKAGVLLSYNAIRSNGLLIEPLLELAYRYEFDGKGNVSYGGAKTESNLSGGTAEINAGLNMQLTDNLYWYGLGSYEASDKVKGWGVHAGIRYGFGGKQKEPKREKGKPVIAKQAQVVQEEGVLAVTSGHIPPEPIVVRPGAAVERVMVSADEEVPRKIENGQVKPLERSMVPKAASGSKEQARKETSQAKHDYTFMKEMERRWREGK